MGEDWLNRVLDGHLSAEPGMGPAADDAWREQAGFGHGFGAPPPPVGAAPPPAAPAKEAPLHRVYALMGIEHLYDEERARFAAMIDGFYRQLTFTLPPVAQMTIADVATAAAWITDVERAVINHRTRANIHAMGGHKEYQAETEAALEGLQRIKDQCAARRTRIAGEEQAAVARINADRAAFEAAQQQARRDAWDKVRAYENETWQKNWEATSRENDERHAEALRRIRGETVIARWSVGRGQGV